LRRNEIGIFSALFLLIPLTVVLLYFWGAFSETGILALPPTLSTLLFVGSSIIFILSFCYLSGKLNILHPSTSITKEQDGKVARVVKNSTTGEEYFIRAEPDRILRTVLKKQWPFNEIDPRSDWHAVDESGNEITDEKLSSFEGTVEIIFEDK
jgi:hypothetical protein